MVRLSRTPRKVLAAVIPIDGKMGFRKAIDDGAIDLGSLGLNRDQFRRYLNERVKLDLVKPERTEDGDKLYCSQVSAPATSRSRRSRWPRPSGSTRSNS